MSLDQRLQRASQYVLFQWAGHTHCLCDICRSVFRVDLIQKPETLLSKRKRSRAGAQYFALAWLELKDCLSLHLARRCHGSQFEAYLSSELSQYFIEIA